MSPRRRRRPSTLARYLAWSLIVVGGPVLVLVAVPSAAAWLRNLDQDVSAPMTDGTNRPGPAQPAPPLGDDVQQ